jgi:hypothetical protein
MNTNNPQNLTKNGSPISEYHIPIGPMKRFDGVRGRVLNALKAQPQSVSLKQATEQIRRFQTGPARSV